MKRNLSLLAILATIIVISCSKSSDDPKQNARVMTDFQKKLSGKWYLDQVGTLTGSADDYFDFTDQLIDSLSSDSVAYRVLNMHVVSNGFCNSLGGNWSLGADSMMQMSCLGNVKVLKLTDNELSLGVITGFSYYPYLIYDWKR